MIQAPNLQIILQPQVTLLHKIITLIMALNKPREKIVILVMEVVKAAIRVEITAARAKTAMVPIRENMVREVTARTETAVTRAAK